MRTDQRILSITAFILLLVGVFAPFFPRAFPSGDLSLVVSIIALILSLAFGVISRAFLLGKVASIGAAVVCLIAITNFIAFSMNSRFAKREMQKKEATAKTEANQKTPDQRPARNAGAVSPATCAPQADAARH